jgi:hypothetical protein
MSTTKNDTSGDTIEDAKENIHISDAKTSPTDICALVPEFGPLFFPMSSKQKSTKSPDHMCTARNYSTVERLETTGQNSKLGIGYSRRLNHVLSGTLSCYRILFFLSYPLFYGSTQNFH